MSTVRLHLKYCILTGIGVVLGMLSAPSAFPAQSPQTPLAGSKIPQFTQAIARVTDMQPVIPTEAQLTFTMCEFDAKVLPPGTPLVDNPTGSTRVWGYINGTTACPTAIPSAQSYLGPVVVATRNQPAEINYVNNLGFANTTQVLAYKYSTDLTLHWADPLGTNPMGGDPLPAESNACNMAGVPAYPSACAQNYAGPIPAVPHVHGGEVPPVLDGGPDAWWTSDGSVKGHGYYTKAGAAANAAVYRYPNGQQAAPIWFHDHTLGATRLNVYMGLAGAYVITDPNLPLPAGMTSIGLLNGPGNPPTQELLIPLVLQDRMFDTNGQLFFPADSAGGELESPNPDHPYWVPEFEGDTIVVNGKAWPFAEVQAKRYRFLFVNGSNARTYEMFLTNPVTKANGPAMWVISTDGGYLDNPVKVDPNAPKGQPQRLVMMPGERYEVIIDFGGLAGTNLNLVNIAKTPYPAGDAPMGNTTGRIVQFRVQAFTGPDNSYNPASGTPLRTDPNKIVRLVNPATGTLASGVVVAKTRQLTLNEVLAPPSTVTDPVTGVLTNYEGGPLEILVNNTKWSGLSSDTTTVNDLLEGDGIRRDFKSVMIGSNTTYYSELPQEGTTEVWELVNLTADAHPIHTHLTTFQILNRQAFNTRDYNTFYGAAFPGGVYKPAFGPPLNYNTGNPRALGGNPDITPYLQGPAMPSRPEEAGWKDTVIALPGQVTRIVVRYAPNSEPLNGNLFYPFDPNVLDHGYVWHCHIVDHEDNEMMRPYQVQPFSDVVRTYLQGLDY